MQTIATPDFWPTSPAAVRVVLAVSSTTDDDEVRIDPAVEVTVVGPPWLRKVPEKITSPFAETFTRDEAYPSKAMAIGRFAAMVWVS